MSSTGWWMIGAAMIVLRLGSLRRFWNLPHKHGRDRFFGMPLDAEALRQEASILRRRFRLWLLAPFALDAVAIAAIAAVGAPVYLVSEQAVAVVLTAIFYHCLVVHFAQRFKSLLPQQDAARPTEIGLSLEPRRLGDHTSWIVETAIAVILAAGVGTLVLSSRLVAEEGARTGLVRSIVWLGYVQMGLLLLKGVFVRWRMRLPSRRTEDYLRWRAAWLAYHLRVFDAVRLLGAGALLWVVGSVVFPAASPTLPLVGAGVATLVFVAYAVRERRRLATVEREVRPGELAAYFPTAPPAAGRYLAGGLLYFNAGNPAVLARGPAGIAINLGNRSTYLWIGYLAGLILLAAWPVLG